MAFRNKKMGKFDKNTKCEYCFEDMDAKYRNKRFCSTRCRVYFNREKNKPEKKKEVIVPDGSEPREGTMAFFNKYGVLYKSDMK